MKGGRSAKRAHSDKAKIILTKTVGKKEERGGSFNFLRVAYYFEPASSLLGGDVKIEEEGRREDDISLKPLIFISS